MYRFRIISLLLAAALLVLSGCKSSEESTSDDDSAIVEGNVSPEKAQLQQVLNNTRSNLTDVYASRKQDMPAVFLKVDSTNNQGNTNPYDGFRIQILSTRNVEDADSVANSFRQWADSTIRGYQPNVHQSFRQPYYRVHVGDFQQREKANMFSQLIKRQYPEAWVVHDRIEPNDVPSDTAKFEIKKPEPLSADTLSQENSN